MKKEILNKAAEIMKHNKVDKLYHTSDGQFFLDENSANNHAIRIHGAKRDKKLNVSEIKASDVGLEIPKTEKTAEDLMKEFEVLSAEKDKAVKDLLTKKEAKVSAERDLKEAKEKQKPEKEEALKKAEAALNEAEEKVNELDERLANLEEEIDKTE